MEVKIGVQHVARELVVETTENPDDIEARLSEALAPGGLLSLVDAKGRRVVVPGDRIAYLEIGTGVSGQVGFRH